MADASLGVGFSYEEVFEMCQTVTKLECERRSRSTNLSKMSTVSIDSGHHMVELGNGMCHGLEDGNGSGMDLDAMRKRLRFRHTVSEVSRNTMSELSEDDGKMLMNKTKLLNSSQILGGKLRLIGILSKSIR